MSSDQIYTHNPNQGQHRNQDLKERETRAHHSYPSNSPDEQQHSLTQQWVHVNLWPWPGPLPHLSGCLIIDFMIGTPEGQIPDTENLDNEAPLPGLIYCCGLNHFDLINKRMQSLLRHWGEWKCRIVDPIGNIDSHLSMIGIACPCIDVKCGH